VSCGLNITVQTGSARLLSLDERGIGGAKVFFDAEEEVLRYESDWGGDPQKLGVDGSVTDGERRRNAKDKSRIQE
jgi:hypothetical protein